MLPLGWPLLLQQVFDTTPAVDLEPGHAQRLAQVRHGELTQVVVLRDRGDPHAATDEFAAQLRRRCPLGPPDQLDEQPQSCAVYSSVLGSGTEAFAEATSGAVTRRRRCRCAG